MALRVIGAGFGRTGTTSLKAALEQLGFGKCHHMNEVRGNQVAAWQSIAEGGKPDWDTIFEGFESSCDFPSCTYWEELSAYYPDAKVILTVRDEGRWWESVAETIYAGSFVVPQWLMAVMPGPLRRFNRMVIAQVWDGVFGGRFLDREHATRIYRDHNADVKERCDAERLLVFEASEGWQPLCEFLGVPVPEGPYPHLNDAKQIRRMITIARVVGWSLVTAVVLGAGLLVFG
jgi:hypothetical protein